MLLNEVKQSRQTFLDKIVKLGIDGGGGFLKVSLGTIDTSGIKYSPPSKRLLTAPYAKTTASGCKRHVRNI